MRIGILTVLLVVAITGGLALRASRGSDEPKFCYPALPIGEVDGYDVTVESSGGDGGECPVPRVNPGSNTLGTDCKIRDPHGKVLASVTTTGKQGTC